MKYVIVAFLFFISTLAKAQNFDTVLVHFAIGSTVLDSTSQNKLEQLSAHLRANTQKKLLVYGYADYLGTSSPNQVLSQQRAHVVARFLQQQKIPQKRFLVTQGLGQFDDKGQVHEKGNVQRRSTMILIPNRDAKNPIPTISNTPNSKQQQSNKPYQLEHILQKDTLSNATLLAAEKLLERISNTSIDSTFVLDNIYFEWHLDVMLPESKPALEGLVAIMQNYTHLEIGIEGHICCNAQDGYNTKSSAFLLSVKRARKIYNYLLSNGIAENRMSFRGYGRMRPIYPEEQTNEEMAANRRVEIRIKTK